MTTSKVTQYFAMAILAVGFLACLLIWSVDQLRGIVPPDSVQNILLFGLGAAAHAAGIQVGTALDPAKSPTSTGA